MTDAHLPCEACEGTGRATRNEHGAYVGGDPETCPRCGGTGISTDLACPACTGRTPDVLMCGHDTAPTGPLCPGCCERDHAAEPYVFDGSQGTAPGCLAHHIVKGPRR